MNNFEYRVLRIELYKDVLVGVHRRMLRMKGSAGHSRRTDLHAFLNIFEHKVFCA